MQTDRIDSSASARPHLSEDSGGVHDAQVRSRVWWTAALLISLACFAGICIWLSAHRMMWDDELDAWNLIADASWRHALSSWNLGADGGPPMYYAIGRLIVMVTGPHPLALRLYSAGCFWLAAVLWVHILKRHFGGTIALGATALAFLCNPEFIDQFAQVRFYGQLVLAFTLAVWVALFLEETRPSRGRCITLSFLAGVFLVVSHPLGIVYSANIAAAQMLGRSPIRNRIAAVAGTVLSWSALLIALRGVIAGAQTTNWLQMPSFMGLVHFYNNHPLLFGSDRHLSVVLNIALLCLIAYACWWFLRHRNSKQLESGSLWLFFCIAFAILLTPVEFFVASHLYKPLFLPRYMLPYMIGFAAMVAAGIWLSARPVIQRHPGRSTALIAVPLVAIVILVVSEQPTDPPSNLEPLLKIAQTMPTVLLDDQPVRQAHFYTSERANNLFYILMKPGEHSTLHSIAQQGYEPWIVFARPFLQQHREFLYVHTPLQPQFYEGALRGNPHWHGEDVGTVHVHGMNLRVYRYTRVD